MTFSIYTFQTKVSIKFETIEVEIATYFNGNHPLELFVKGDLETRKDVILNHPDVIECVYLNEGVITKDFIPKKVVNFKVTDQDNRKVIVAVSGSTEKYTPFIVPEKCCSVTDSILLILTTLPKKVHISQLEIFVRIIRPSYHLYPMYFRLI